MKYILQIYLNEAEMAGMTVPATDELNREHHEFDDWLVRAGQMIATGALEAADRASCVRVRASKVAVTDGPFAESKEQVAGFFVIDARDFNEAIHIASRIPSARIGTVEVRALRPLVIEGKEYWCMDRIAENAANS